MYLLVQKDCFCEMNISENLLNLFEFEQPRVKEENEIIGYLNDLLEKEESLSKTKFIREFNQNDKYEIINI